MDEYGNGFTGMGDWDLEFIPAHLYGLLSSSSQFVSYYKLSRHTRISCFLRVFHVSACKHVRLTWHVLNKLNATQLNNTSYHSFSFASLHA